MDMQLLGEFDGEILPEKTETKLCPEGDLSGLELLAAAASMHVDSDNPLKEDIAIEDSSMPKRFNAASFVTDSVLDPECNKSGYMMVQEAVIGYSQLLNSTSVNAQGQLGSVENENKPRSTLKVNRRHWDLNTEMDAWDNPYDDSICRNICEDVDDDIVPEIQIHEKLEYLALLNLNCMRVESPNVKVEEIKLKAGSPKEIFVHSSSNEDHLEEPDDNISNNAASESFAEVNENDIDFPTTSVCSTVGVEKIESPVALVEKIDQTVDASHDLDMHLDGQSHLVDRTEIMSQEGCDSPYEDGELRGSFVYPWEDNELDINYVDYESNRRNDGSDAADFHGSDIVDGGSEGSHGSDKKSLLKGLSSSGNKCDGRVLERSIRRYIMKTTSETDKIGKNASNEESATDENEEGSKRIFTDLSAVDDKVAQVDEHMLKPRKLQSCTSYSSLGAVDENDVFFMKQCRSRRRSCLESCSERDTFFDKYSSRYRPHFDERIVADKWTNWGSWGHCSSAHHGVEGRSMASDDRDDSFGARRRLPGARYEGMNMRENYPRFASREFDTRTDDIPNTVRMLHSTSRRKQILSPSSGKRFHVSSTHERSPSRLGTRTPLAWHSLVERNSSTKGHVRSLDLRSEARIDKIRLPFSKSTFSSDHRKGSYFSPPRGRLSPDCNDRWSDKHYFEDNRPMKRRREPVRVFRHSQRLDTVTSGRTKSGEFFRPAIDPRRFSFIRSDVTDCKFENNEERKRDSGGGVIHGGRYVGDVGNLRRF